MLSVCYFKKILLAAAGLAALSGCGRQNLPPAAGPPVVPVSVAKAGREAVPVEVDVVGTVEASAIVQIKSQVAGELTRVQFVEGQNVAKDAPLFEIDPQPYRDALRQAEANLARDRAQVLQAEAALARDAAQAKNAETDAYRNEQLEKDGLASRTQFEQAHTSAQVYRESARASKASIASAQAAVEADQAAVARAKLDLGYCEIRAPIAGRTGNLLVHPGNLIKVNDVPLVVINRVEPIFVTFSVPEQHLAAIRRLSATRRLPVRVTVEENNARTATGYLAVIDNTVDPATGTIRLKAAFDNHDGLLWPGQFVSVALTLETISDATVIPSEAVQAGQQGQFVYIVKANNTVEARPVTPGRLFGRQVVIEKGVAPGELVVTDGYLRLFPGAPVKAVQPVGAGAPAS